MILAENTPLRGLLPHKTLLRLNGMNGPTLKTQKTQILLGALALCLFAGTSFAQDRVFNWLPANDETVRLDPAHYHTGRTYRPDALGQNKHVAINPQKPITIL